MKKILIGIFVLMLLSGIVSGCASCMGDCSEGCEGGDWYPEYAITNVYYDYASKTLSWSDNSNAQEWVVNIGPIGGDKKEENVTTTSYTYEADKKGFEVSIEGLHEKKGSEINPTTGGVITFHYLPVATGLDIENGKLVWDSVLGASAYNVYNNGGLLATVSECEVVVPVGPFSLKVEPIVTGERQYSYSDAPTIFDGVILSSPTSAYYADGVLSWNAVNGADYYDVVINDGEPVRVNGQVSLEYDGAKKDVKVSIAAGSHAERAYPAEPYKVTFTYIPPVTEFSLNDDNKLVWPAAEKATYYEIYINGENRGTVELPGIDGIMLDTEYTIQVIPRADYSYTDSIVPYNFMCMAMIEGIRFDNGTIYWNAHSLAKSYEVRVNGKSFIVEKDPTDPNAAPMLETNIKEEDVSIQVFAVGEKENFRSYKANTITYRYLKPVTGMALNEDGNLTWTSVTNATYYEIFMLEELYGEIRRTSLGTVATNEFTNITPNTPYNVEIIPHCDLSYTGTPGSFKFEKLTPVNNVVFSNGIITWDEHSRAAEYEVVITDLSTKKTETFKTTDTKYKLGNITKSIGIQVFAVGEGENCRSFTSSKEPYNYLPTVTNLRVEDGILKWDASKSDSVIGYTVEITQNGSTVTENVMDTAFANIIPNTQYLVRVIPNGSDSNCFSYWSASFDFTVLPTPTLSQSGGTLKWNKISDASAYVVRITKPDGTSEDISLNEADPSYNCGFITTPGTYTVSVKYDTDISATPKLYGSAYSEPFTVIQLASVSGHAVDYSTNNSDTFNFSVTPVDGAIAYKVFINGTEMHESSGYNFNLPLSDFADPNAGNTFNVAIKAVGKSTTDKLVLDAKSNWEFSVIKLSTPQNVRLDGTSIKWDAVGGNPSYAIKIEGKSGVATSNTATYQPPLNTITAGTNYTIKVCAIAAKSEEASAKTEYLNSDWSLGLTFSKLPTPVGVTITPVGSHTDVQWESGGGTPNGYTVVINGNKIVTTDEFKRITDNLTDLEPGTSVSIYVYANGNGSTVMDSEPSATITIGKFAQPSGLAIQGDVLRWDRAEVNGVAASTYRLYINGETIDVNTNEYSTANLPIGTYTVAVQALGDANQNTVDSPMSGALQVTKLGQIENFAPVNGGKGYTWDSIDNVSYYEITINGTALPQLATNEIADISSYFQSAGDYTIRIRAVANGRNSISGDWFEYIQKVKALDKPNYVAGADPTTLTPGQFTTVLEGTTVTIHAQAPVNETLTIQYQYLKGNIIDKTTDLNSHTIDFAGSEGRQVIIKVSYIVSGFSDNIYYVSSIPSADVKLFIPLS